MPFPNKHEIYSKDAAVYIETGTDKLDALQRAIDHSSFFDNLEAVFTRSGKPRADFLIAIKPNIMTASFKEEDSSVYTDPQLVEYLIGKMRERGFANIAVVESQNVYNYSYEGRTVNAVAAMVGYTEQGYRVEDLSQQKEPHDYGSILGQHVVGRTWRDADYRISFAKNKSHWQCFYTACLKNIYGCLPEWDKMKVYHGHRGKDNIEFFLACILMLDNFPVHFGFLDAWVSGDGFSGHVRDARPNRTLSIFASENVVALDWVVGEKMSINPALNYVMQEAMHRWGTFHITRVGNMTPWQGWLNVRPLAVLALDAIEEFYPVQRFFSRAFAYQQDAQFPPAAQNRWLYSRLQGFTGLLERILVKEIGIEF